MKKILLWLVFIWILLLISTSAFASEIVISDVASNPEGIEPGGKAKLNLIIRNIGDKDIENIAIKFNFDDVPFAPLNSASTKIIDKLKEGRNKEVVFDIIVMPDAKVGVYKIPISISYKDFTDETSISLLVASKPKLDVFMEKSDVYSRGDIGEITLKVINKGFSDIKFLTVILEEAPNYKILSNRNIYIGNIDADDFETVNFKIYLEDINGFLPIVLEYKGNDNKFYREELGLLLNVYSADEARALGLKKTRSYLWVSIISILLLLLITYKVWNRKRTKK